MANSTYFIPFTPTPYTDGDDLEDGTEVHGWTIHVETDGCNPTANACQPIEYDPDGRPMEVTSNPREADTDGDGLTDKQEKTLRTDPNATVTYEMTKRRSRWLQALHDEWTQASYPLDEHIEDGIYALGVLDGRTIEDLDDIWLTDATDDFDFVTTDAYAFRTKTDGLTRLASGVSIRTPFIPVVVVLA